MSRKYPNNFVEKVLSWKPAWLVRKEYQPERPLQELVDAERLPTNYLVESVASKTSFADIYPDQDDSDYPYRASAVSEGISPFNVENKYYSGFLPLVAGESYAHLAEGYNSNDKMRWFDIKILSKRAYPADPYVTIVCQGRIPKDYAESTIVNVLYIPKYYSSQEVLGVASYQPDPDNQTRQIKIKIPKISDEEAYSEGEDALSEGVVLKAKFLHSLVTEMRIYEACSRATSLPYMNQLLTAKLSYTAIPEGEELGSGITSPELAGGGGGGGGVRKEAPEYVLGIKSMLGDMRWNSDVLDTFQISSDPAQQAGLISEILKRRSHRQFILTSDKPELLLRLANEWAKAENSPDMKLVDFDGSLPHSLIKYAATFSTLLVKERKNIEEPLVSSIIAPYLLIPIAKLLTAEKGMLKGTLIFINAQQLDESVLLNFREHFPSSYSFQVKSDGSAPAHSLRLNLPQQAAIKRVLMTDDPVMLLQGPPGTGKTTTTVALLEELIFRGKVMVCAPSNKAVQVLASRFFDLHPEWPVILVGVDKKVPEHLLPISLHSFGAVVKGMIDEFDRLILKATQLKLPKTMEESVRKYLTLHKSVSLSQFIDLAIGKISTLQSLSDISLSENELKALRESEKAIKSYLTCHSEIKHTLLVCQSKIPQKLKDILPKWPSLVRLLNKKFENYEFEGVVRMQEKSSEINSLVKKFLNSPNISLETAFEILREIKNYFTLCKSGVSDKRELERILLGSARVVFCTLSVSGRNSFSSDLGRVDYLVVDEASQASEALTLVPLQHMPSRLLLVGDTKQLPATVLSEAAKAKRYDWSLMWRLYEENQQRADMLTIQYRMHPDICRWPSSQFYDGHLLTDPVVKADRVNFVSPCQLLKRPRAFYSIPSEQEQPVVSYRNKLEALYILAIVKHIRAVDRVNTIGIISFYSAQVLLLTRLMNSYLDKKTRVSTVDGFQGDECHYIILSCVRSESSIGFLSDFRRLNVSVTRPMHNLLVVGNLPFLVKKASHLQAMIQDMIERREVVEREELDQLLQLNSEAKFAKLVDLMIDLTASEHDEGKNVQSGGMVASPQKVCFQYNGTPTSCRFGNKCKFLHQPRSGSSIVNQRSDRRGYNGGGGGGHK